MFLPWEEREQASPGRARTGTVQGFPLYWPGGLLVSRERDNPVVVGVLRVPCVQLCFSSRSDLRVCSSQFLKQNKPLALTVRSQARRWGLDSSRDFAARGFKH